MKQPTGFFPRLRPDVAGSGLVSQAGAAVLLEAVRAVGLDRALRDELGSWRRPTAVHDPAKVVLDLAVTLALGGDGLADVALLVRSRACSGRWRRTRGVSRTIDTLAADAEKGGRGDRHRAGPGSGGGVAGRRPGTPQSRGGRGPAAC